LCAETLGGFEPFLTATITVHAARCTFLRIERRFRAPFDQLRYRHVRLAQRLLALRPAHSHGERMSGPLSEGFRHFVSSMPAPVASGWSGRRVGLAPTGKAPPCRGARGQRNFALISTREAQCAARVSQKDERFREAAKFQPSFMEGKIRRTAPVIGFAWRTTLTWLFIAACAVAAWVIGYGLGYRRGIKDAMSSTNPSAEQRINGN
jgi:hypothetical protein